MVDCRLCKHHYTIYTCEIDENSEEKKLVCMAKEVFIDKKYVSEGPCDLYVDVDWYIPGDGDL